MDKMSIGIFDWTRYAIELQKIKTETRRIAVFLIIGSNPKG
jgi:hypothetical protein